MSISASMTSPRAPTQLLNKEDFVRGQNSQKKEMFYPCSCQKSAKFVTICYSWYTPCFSCQKWTGLDTQAASSLTTALTGLLLFLLLRPLHGFFWFGPWDSRPANLKIEKHKAKDFPVCVSFHLMFSSFSVFSSVYWAASHSLQFCPAPFPERTLVFLFSFPLKWLCFFFLCFLHCISSLFALDKTVSP